MYLDPGFGSMIIQLIVGAAAAIGVFFFAFKNKIKDFFSKKKTSAQADDSPEASTQVASVEDKQA